MPWSEALVPAGRPAAFNVLLAMFGALPLRCIANSVQKHQQQNAGSQHACRHPELNIGQNGFNCLRSAYSIHWVSILPGLDRFGTATQSASYVVALL